MTNRPEFLEALFAIWHAGLVAVPMNAKLHSEEFGYIIGNTEASLDSGKPRPRRRRRTARPHHRDRQRRVAQPLSGRRHRRGAARARRSGVAVLYQRHHRPPQGRDAHPSQSDGADARLLRRDRTGQRRRLRSACSADVAWLGLLRPALRRHGRQHHRAGERGLRSGRNRGAAAGSRQCQFLCRADHGEPARQSFGVRRRRSSRFAHHHLWRRADAFRNPVERHGFAGAEIRADLRPGRSAHDHHRADKGHARRPHAAALARDHGLGRTAPHQCRSARRRRRRPTVACRRDRRGAGPRRSGDERLLEKSARRPRKRCAAAGCTPATWARSTRKVS